MTMALPKMNYVGYVGLVLISSIQSFGQESIQRHSVDRVTASDYTHEIAKNPGELIVADGQTIESRIRTPNGFDRTRVDNRSFAAFLRELQLKPHGSKVRLFNGNSKPNQSIYDAVVNLPIGDRDLHQCADAVMRLRAEYLWNHEQFDKIHFNFTNGFRADYNGWMKGNRVVVDGDRTFWSPSSSPSNTYQDFWEYMEIIFSYAGTISLSKEMLPVSTDELGIGDVFIQGGSPGHAIIVVDLAENYETKEIIFLLAQSFMPAQEIHILKNPNKQRISPWYSVDFGKKLETPEWTFYETDLKRFEE